jgi:hypothetical protein
MSSCKAKPIPVGVDSTVTIQSSAIKGFVPTAAGTWTFTLRYNDGAPDITLPGIPVQTGNIGLFHKLPIFAGTVARSSVTTSGGGAGILITE